MNRSAIVVSILIFVMSFYPVFAQQVTVQSPNQKITVALFSRQNTGEGEWCLKASYSSRGKLSEVIPRIDLGLVRSDQDFSKELRFLKAGKPVLINEQFTVVHGKRSVCSIAIVMKGEATET